MNRQSTFRALFLLLTVCTVNACSSSVTTAGPSSNPSPQVTASQSAPNPTEPKANNGIKQVAQGASNSIKAAKSKVKVFFPKGAPTAQNLTDVEAVWRTTESKSVATFAMEQLIAGPQAAERQRGLVNAVKLSGNSNCGRDFTISVTNGVAKLKFCKDVVSAGVGDDARAKTAINATLKQFPTVKSAIILDKNGNCLADQSGENLCLKTAQR